MVTHYRWFFELLIWLVPTLLAISWRESVKAWVCHLRGDPTIKTVGATSFGLNNLDPIGSALSPVLLILGHTSVYGWARPTEIRANFLKQGSLDAALVVLAGLLTNFFMAVGWAEIARLAIYLEKASPNLAEIVVIAAKAGININVILVAIHLIPLPPLDMSYIVRGQLSRYPKAWYTYIDPIGHHIIFLLFLFKIAPPYVQPIVNFVTEQVQLVAGF